MGRGRAPERGDFLLHALAAVCFSRACQSLPPMRTHEPLCAVDPLEDGAYTLRGYSVGVAELVDALG